MNESGIGICERHGPHHGLVGGCPRCAEVRMEWVRGDKFNNFITAKGRAAIEAVEDGEDDEFARVIDKLRGGKVIDGEATECPP